MATRPGRRRARLEGDGLPRRPVRRGWPGTGRACGRGHAQRGPAGQRPAQRRPSRAPPDHPPRQLASGTGDAVRRGDDPALAAGHGLAHPWPAAPAGRPVRRYPDDRYFRAAGGRADRHDAAGTALGLAARYPGRLGPEPRRVPGPGQAAAQPSRDRAGPGQEAASGGAGRIRASRSPEDRTDRQGARAGGDGDGRAGTHRARRRRGGGTARDVPWWALAGTLVVAAGFAVWQFAENSQQIIVLRDPATYLQFAYWIAGHGSTHIPESLQAFGGAHQGLTFSSLGFFQVGSSVVPQFMAGLPMLLAIGVWPGGALGAAAMAPILGALAVLSFAGLAGRLAGARWAPAAALVLAVCLPEQYTSRATFSETLAQLMLYGGLCMLADSFVLTGGRHAAIYPGPSSWRDGPAPNVTLAFFGGLSIGLTLLVRIDGLSDLLPALPFLGVLLVRKRPQGCSVRHRSFHRCGVRLRRRLPVVPALSGFDRPVAAAAGDDRPGRGRGHRRRHGTAEPSADPFVAAGPGPLAPGSVAPGGRRGADGARAHRVRRPPVLPDGPRRDRPRDHQLRRANCRSSRTCPSTRPARTPRTACTG